MDRADIQRAALFRFATQGYHATTLRLLAQDLGVTPAAFYYHFKNKDELLTALIEEIVAGDLELLRAIRREGEGDTLDKLIYAHVYGMCHGREEALVVEREAKYLKHSFRKRVARIVHQYESLFEECISDQYDLSGPDLTLATRAVIGLGGSVIQWFHQGGELGEHEVALMFTRYARGVLASTASAAKEPTVSEAITSTAALNGDEPFRDIAFRIRERVAVRRRTSATITA
jgi:AcrR family transcriptional regulator